MRAYVTAVGTSPEAVFNPLWCLAECHSWVPDEVYLLWNDNVAGELGEVYELIKRLSTAYGADIKVIADESLKFDEADAVEFREKVGSLVEALKGKGYDVVVDITPGRKFMSALLLGAAMAKNADDVTYLHLREWTKYVGRLLFEVPMVKQRLFTGRELAGVNGTLDKARRKKESPGVFKIDREHIMAVLNSLHIDGVTRFPLKVRNTIIGSVTLGETASVRIPDYIDLDDQLHGGHTMVKEALIAGGMAKLKNWEELVSMVKRLKGDGRPLYIGFDTNALYFRLPSKLLGEGRFYSGGSLIFDFVYSDEVALEVGRAVNDKLPYDRALGVYSNQPKPRARLASLGRVELERLRERGAERADSRENFHGDTKIALDYKVFAEEKDSNVLVITLDDRAYAEMESLKGSGLIPFKLEWSFSFGETFEGTWEELRDTLYALAATLGELNLHGYKLRGLWHGKSSTDWKNETVELRGFEYGRLFRVLGAL
ncbi:hypothetical protein APY94_04185 [Thermococcus celericrescens]|uniref:Uncharacterized protein n=1 Tax=Thermococcus celericrescens TaxID=227598 RepID=A0A100XYJ3_9EURY|nr:hypothetical protein [Thermococcus celericrescens]KUH33935.1 hypothetical protein APY94_04185 [Thermococcus celericrescens]